MEAGARDVGGHNCVVISSHLNSAGQPHSYKFKDLNYIVSIVLSCFRILKTWGAWLTQSVEHATLHLGVVSSSPTLGVEILKNKILYMYWLWKKRNTYVVEISKKTFSYPISFPPSVSFPKSNHHEYFLKIIYICMWLLISTKEGVWIMEGLECQVKKLGFLSCWYWWTMIVFQTGKFNNFQHYPTDFLFFLFLFF